MSSAALRFVLIFAAVVFTVLAAWSLWPVEVARFLADLAVLYGIGVAFLVHSGVPDDPTRPRFLYDPAPWWEYFTWQAGRRMATSALLASLMALWRVIP